MKLINLILESSNVGYRMGNLEYPSETLKSRGWNFTSKIGYLGTGYYFVSSVDKAQDISNTTRKEEIYSIDLSKYNLFKPANPEAFYEDLKSITPLVADFAKDNSIQDLDEEAFFEIYEIFSKEHGISIDKESFRKALGSFIEDVQQRKDGTLLSNRILEPLGYDGIDNTGTDTLDNYGVGSLIFPSKLKKDSITRI